MMEMILVEASQANALQIFTQDGIDVLLRQIEAEAKAFTPDTQTVKGRKEIASMAHRVSKAKVVLDDLGKDLVAEWKKQSKAVDEQRKIARDFLDALRDEVRQPLTEWEAAEAAREAAEQLAKEIEDAHDVALSEHAMWLKQKDLEAREAELARIEAERLAKEAAEKSERERLEREARMKAEAAEQARLQAEAEAKAKIAEAERKEKEAQEAAARAERERIAAEERAKVEKEMAIKEAERKAKEEAERVERERIAAEQQRQAEEAARAADLENKRRIHREIVADLKAQGVTEDAAKQVIKAIATGSVRHIRINY